MKTSFHEPAMVKAVVEFLAPGPGRVVVDATVGGGGHAEAVLSWAGPGGENVELLIGIDRDPEALAEAGKRLWRFGARAILRRGSYEGVREILKAEGLNTVSGILLDLGASRHQLTAAARGFSLKADADLDMRMDQGAGETAAELLARLPERELAGLLWEYGEERAARKIARAIIARRESGRPVARTAELRELVERAAPGHRSGLTPPAARTFMALRIAVNDELNRLERALAAIPDCLEPGGRVAAISYHSLEDRLVKSAFNREAKGCVCPPGLPRCVCGRKPRLRVLTRRPLRPGADEVERNPAARGAKLRAAERLEDRP